MKGCYSASKEAHAHAKTLMPGGVNSPVRAYSSVGLEPVTIQRGEGAYVWDIDGNSYIDYVSAYGPLILGHAHPAVVEAVSRTIKDGLAFGMPTRLESQLAEMVIDRVPSVEVVRFVNSGTEAVMSAIRLARGFTDREKVIKCIGGYHGHMDGLLVSAGSGLTTLGVPSSPGVTHGTAANTLLMHYNDLQAAAQLLEKHGDEVAAIIVEPIAGNMGIVPPAKGYLEGLLDLCETYGALLIFDEVMTGLRVSRGGAQELYGVTPHLTTLGKVVGGGMPCAAYGGRSDIMRMIAPDGPVYQAGTLSGNPAAMAAGISTLEQLDESAYETLERYSNRLSTGLMSKAGASRLNVQINRVGSMMTLFFNANPVTNYTEATASDTDAFAKFFKAILDAGVTLAPSQYEGWFISLAHVDTVVDQTLLAAEAGFKSL